MRIHRLLSVSLLLGLFLPGLTQAISPSSIKKETADYLVDIQYPQGFSKDSVNNTIKEFIANTQKSFLAELSEDDDTPADAPGKTGIKVMYSIPYTSSSALSVRFDISIYHKGAAHPLNTIVIKNFIKGEEVTLADLFRPETPYLQSIAHIAHQAISDKKISDADWIKEGTAAKADNYKTWQFNAKGIDIIFNTYQVAAYVYGEQNVFVPLSLISALLKPELAKTVWGH